MMKIETAARGPLSQRTPGLSLPLGSQTGSSQNAVSASEKHACVKRQELGGAQDLGLFGHLPRLQVLSRGKATSEPPLALTIAL